MLLIKGKFVHNNGIRGIGIRIRIGKRGRSGRKSKTELALLRVNIKFFL